MKYFCLRNIIYSQLGKSYVETIIFLTDLIILRDTDIIIRGRSTKVYLINTQNKYRLRCSVLTE